MADYVEAMEYVINLVGEDIVGVGTDFTQGYGQPFFDWITHDKGFGRKLTDFGAVINPEASARSATTRTSPPPWSSAAGPRVASRR